MTLKGKLTEGFTFLMWWINLSVSHEAQPENWNFLLRMITYFEMSFMCHLKLSSELPLAAAAYLLP